MHTFWIAENVYPTQKHSFNFTFHILHDHTEVTACLKWAEHRHHKWVLGEGEDVSLYKSLLNLVPQDQILTVYLFHRKALPGLFVAHQVHSPVKHKEILI